MDTKLVIVTGIPSAGKSTSSQFVAEQLELNHIPTEWVWEIALNQAFFPKLFASINNWDDGIGNVLLEEWQGFIQHIQASDKTLVCDSAFVGVYMLLASDQPRTTILDYARQLYEHATPLAPKVIHLVGDVDALLQKSYVERGQMWIDHITKQVEESPYQMRLERTGLASVTQYFEDAQQLLSDVFAAQKWDFLTIDVSAGAWADYQDAMLNFLGCERVQVEKYALTETNLPNYVGEYVAGEDKFMVVHEGATALSLQVPGLRLGALIPKSVTQFEIQATPMRVDFMMDAGGQATHLVFTQGNAEPQRFARNPSA